MIPTFPVFKNIELSDKNDIEKITSKHPPYSDFNFVSMWSWDTKGEMRISQLYGNLIVRFTDYINDKPFYSFIGTNRVNETVKILFNLSEKEGLRMLLKLVPEESIQNLDTKKFIIKEDRDNFDYIYNISHLSSFKGSKYVTHRNLVKQFCQKYPSWNIDVINFAELCHKKDILSLYEIWLKSKMDSCKEKNSSNEFMALNKLLSLKDPIKHNLNCFAIYIEKKLVGFIINEHTSNHSIVHFEKAHIELKGSYSFLMHQNSKKLDSLNLKFLNFEQDLGIDALKFTKNKLGPTHFLKKYLVTKK